MNYLYENITIPKWISYRTYFPLQKNSRTYILNERKHTYVQLDDITSDFWYQLTNGEQEYLAFIQEKGLSEDADAFLETLADQDLIVLKNRVIKNRSSDSVLPSNNSDEYAHFVEEMNQWLYDNHFMSSIFFELTYRCNLKCIHCYNPKHMSEIEIPFDKIQHIIDEAYDLGCLTVTISGGEATTYSRFSELIRYIRDKHMALVVFTNGQRLADDDALYQELKNIYPHQIGVSLYSMDKEHHETVTAVPGSYEKTMKIIQRLRDDDIDVQIKNFLLGFSCHDCMDVAAFGDKIKANVVADISLIPTIEGDQKTLSFALSDNDLFDLFSNDKSPLFIGTDPYLFFAEDHQKESLCFGGFSGICVSPNLEVHVCTSLPMALGNLNQESLSSIWVGADNKDENNKLYQWRKKTIADLPDCYHESYCRFCHYCAGMGYLENGYLRKSDVLCSQAKAKEKAYNYLQQRKRR